jgi:hypothetical protein
VAALLASQHGTQLRDAFLVPVAPELHRDIVGSTELGGFLFLRNLSFDRGPLLLALFLLRHLAVVGGIAAVEGRGESRKIERGLRRRPARWAGLVK